MEQPRVGSVLFTVYGTEGSYSDRNVWTVAAYLEKAKAEALAARLNAWVKAYLQEEDEKFYVAPDSPNAATPDVTLRQVWNGEGRPMHDRAYGVDVLFLHENPDALDAEHATLTDWAKEKGLIP